MNEAANHITGLQMGEKLVGVVFREGSIKTVFLAAKMMQSLKKVKVQTVTLGMSVTIVIKIFGIL
jgi:hypothetical protein